MGALQERKIDCHNHILDPRRYPYLADVAYKPAGQEIGTEAQLHAVCDTYGVEHCLVVGPNSGYGLDNRCLLDAIARGKGRFKGVAVVERETSSDALADLKARGIVGIAINATYHGVDYYRDFGPLIARLAKLDMFLQIQVEGDQLVQLMPLIERAEARMLIDHCGRPDLSAGAMQPGCVELRGLGRSGRVTVKLSGIQKFSRTEFPYRDAWDHIRSLVDAFGLDQCVWGSDWPFLRAPERLDYGPLLSVVDQLFPSEADRKKLLWDTPKRLFGFGT